MESSDDMLLSVMFYSLGLCLTQKSLKVGGLIKNLTLYSNSGLVANHSSMVGLPRFCVFWHKDMSGTNEN